ncbi:MAG: hypothetical protein AB1817_05070 [Chloroflexota bacterium]
MKQVPPPEIEPRAQGIVARLRDRLSDMTPLEQLLWALAGLLAIVAIVVFIPTLVPGAKPGARVPTVMPTSLAQGSPATRSPSPTVPPVATPTRSPTPPVTLAPLTIPTPPAEGQSLTFAPNPDRTGWLGSKELAPHLRDRNLHSGAYQGQSLVGVMQFDLNDLPPGSKILYAALELTGRNARFLGQTGEWSVEMIDAQPGAAWDDASYDAMVQLPRLALLGKPYAAQELAAGLVNRVVFTPDQLKQLEKELDNGALTLRVRGPTGANDNLFTWDAGPGVTAPILYLVTVPASYVVVTVTPTPENVFAAATVVAQQTQFAKQFGSPTAFPRSIATATPGNTPNVIVTNTPTPMNAATETYRSDYATAVAATTGTFTPAPAYWITATPFPLMIPMASLTPFPTVTATPIIVDALQLAKQPLPSGLYNKILFLSGSRQAPNVLVMDPDGKNLGLITDRAVYDRAAARDRLSPDGAFWLYNAPDLNFPDTLQIWSQYQNRPPVPPQRMTAVQRGVAYAPAWSPHGNKFVYVSSETGRDELWLLDLETKKTQQLTFSKDWYWNQFPSWSPDGKRIAFSSDRGHIGSFTEIWTMTAEGVGEIKLGDGTRDAWSPVWVKWRQ